MATSLRRGSFLSVQNMVAITIDDLGVVHHIDPFLLQAVVQVGVAVDKIPRLVFVNHF